ncbi:MAG: hypothetical protein ACTSVU_08460 [Promethearchaeota archaeon]
MPEKSSNIQTKIEESPNSPQIENGNSKNMPEEEIPIKEIKESIIPNIGSEQIENTSSSSFSNPLSVNLSNINKKFTELAKMELSAFFPRYEALYNYLNFVLTSDLPEKEETLEFQTNLQQIFIKICKGDLLEYFLQRMSIQDHLQFFSLEKIINKPLNNIDQKNLILKILNNIQSNLNVLDFTKPFIFYLPINDILADFRLQCIENFPFKEDFDPFITLFMRKLLDLLQKSIPKSSKGFLLFSQEKETPVIMEAFKTYQKHLDLSFNIAFPRLQDRTSFLYSLLKYTENLAPTIEIEPIARLMDNWNLQSIMEFAKYAKNIYSSQKNFKKQAMKFMDTAYFIDLLENDDFWIINNSQIPLISRENSLQSQFFNSSIKSSKYNRNFSINRKQKSPNSEIESLFLPRNFQQQLYQQAASSNFNILCTTLDKMSKGLTLQPFERNTLSEYPFLLKEDPTNALQKLNKAKMRIEKILATQNSIKLKNKKEKNDPID